MKSALHKSPVIFSTDMYKECSVKGVERKRRSCGDKLIVGAGSTKRPKDWKTFLTNDENKEQLIQVLFSTWSSEQFSGKLVGHEVTLICEGRAYHLLSDGDSTTCEEIVSLLSTQEETDSRVILYCFYAKERGFKFVRVRSPDSDIFFILLYYAERLSGLELLFETGRGNKRRCISITQVGSLLTPALCDALLGLHAYTGCDSTSAFKGKGKVKAIKLVEKKQGFKHVFARVGETWEVDEDLLDSVEEFTCALYGKQKVKNVNELRYLLLQTKYGKDDGTLDKSTSFDLSGLPPCRDVLREHLKRVNFQVAIWKRAHIAKPDIPDPASGHGWTHGDKGGLVPKWTSGVIMPPLLADVLERLQDESDSESDDDDDDLDFDVDEMSSDTDSDDDTDDDY